MENHVHHEHFITREQPLALDSSERELRALALKFAIDCKSWTVIKDDSAVDAVLATAVQFEEYIRGTA